MRRASHVPAKAEGLRRGIHGQDTPNRTGTKMTQTPNGSASRSLTQHALSLLLATLLLSVLTGCDRIRGQAESQEGSEARATSENAAAQASVAEAEAGEPHLEPVHLGAERADAMGIRVETLDGGRASSVLSRPATLMLDPDRKALVGPRLEAKVVRVTADLGAEVVEGDTLAILSSVELGRAKSAFLTTRARFRTADAEYRRERNLHEKEISSEAELLEAEARFREARAELDASREALRLYGLSRSDIEGVEAGGEAPLSYFPLRSPVTGRVQQRDLAPGQSVGPRETPIHVAAVDRLWVMIEAFERDVPHLEPGQRVTLSVRSLPGRTFEGELDWVSYELEPETRTVRARAIVDNPGGSLRGGMFGSARVRTSSEARYALAPVDAVQTLEGVDVVFVPAEEAGAFRPVPVRLGEESQGGLVELVSGLEPGDRAVVVGAFDLMSAATAGSRSASHGH